MLPGQMFPGQMSTWQLESVQDGPRNLLLKFGKNRISNSRDIPDMDKCPHDKCCLDKCPRDSLNLAMTVVVNISVLIFFFYSPMSQPFLTERVLESKYLICKSWSERTITFLSRPRQAFCGPLANILDFAGCSIFLKEGSTPIKIQA